MQISNRVQSMGEPALLKYYPLVDQAKAKGIQVYYLNIGQPDIKTPKRFMDTIQGGHPEVLEYAQPEGEIDLREAAGAYYKRHGLLFEKDEMLITNGGSEALLFTFLTLFNPGDEVLTPEPLYSIYKEMASVSGISLKGIQTYAEDGFALPSTEVLRAAVTEKTKGFLMTNPGNPTGKVFNQAEVNRIAELALAHNLYVITDEVYREFIYEGNYVSPAHDSRLDQQCVVIDSISKRYSACGARIGFVLSKNKDVLYALRKLCQMRLAVSSVDQIGARELFKLNHHFFDAVIAEYRKRRDIVYACLKTIPGVVAKKPTGAFYYMAKLPVVKATDFIEWMITDFQEDGETVLLSPANDFYLNPNNGADEVRIAYVLKSEDLQRAMDLLKKGLEAYRLARPEAFKETPDVH